MHKATGQSINGKENLNKVTGYMLFKKKCFKKCATEHSLSLTFLWYNSGLFYTMIQTENITIKCICKTKGTYVHAHTQITYKALWLSLNEQ